MALNGQRQTPTFGVPATVWLEQTVQVTIDRPLGSRHPEHGFIYPVNYGYLPDVMGADGEELDAYVLGVFEPRETFIGVCLAVIHRVNDDDDKLIVAPVGKVYSEEQIRALTEFQERFFTSVILRKAT